MRCTVTSPVSRDSFDKLASIRLVTTSGGREILPGHIAMLAELQPGSLVELLGDAQESPPIHIMISSTGFLQFSDDTAMLLADTYRIVPEGEELQ